MVGTQERLYADSPSLQQWVEVWDYAGDLRFRGFVGENAVARSLFVFFDSSVVGKDLKPGYIAPFRTWNLAIGG